MCSKKAMYLEKSKRLINLKRRVVFSKKKSKENEKEKVSFGGEDFHPGNI
jgi:hypothetical protein